MCFEPVWRLSQTNNTCYGGVRKLAGQHEQTSEEGDLRGKTVIELAQETRTMNRTRIKLIGARLYYGGVNNELAKNETSTRLTKWMADVGDWLEMGSRCVSIARQGRVWRPLRPAWK